MGRYVDLTGKKFNFLTVLERDYDYPKEHNLKNTKSYWKCKCDCGKITIVRGTRLTSGETKSCGCYATSCKMNNDLIGKTFGELTVLYPTEKRDHRQSVIWHCKCSCGKECDVSRTKLLNGTVTSCHSERSNYKVGENYYEFLKGKEQYQFIDLTNQKFGKLTALYPVKHSDTKTNGTRWFCHCDCGNDVIVREQNLREGKTQSCGCLTESQGEMEIKELLMNNNIQFEKEKIFSDFIYEDTEHHPRYDFYLPDYNRLIEFDGEQHFSEYRWDISKDDFKKEKNEIELKTNMLYHIILI